MLGDSFHPLLTWYRRLISPSVLTPKCVFQTQYFCWNKSWSGSVGVGEVGAWGQLELCRVRWPPVLIVSSGGAPVQEARVQEEVATGGNGVNSQELAGRPLVVLSTSTF